MYSILFLLFIGLASAQTDDFDYCTLNEQCLTYQHSPHEHILCTYPDPTPGPLCTGYDNSSHILEEEKQVIVDMHNYIRNFVATGQEPTLPRAANMHQLYWSDTLAYTAQRVADQCQRQHGCSDFQNGSYVGQNLAWVASTNITRADVGLHVRVWFADVKIFMNDSIDWFNYNPGVEWYHFVQLLWGESRYVGCGRASYYTNESTDETYYATVFVCNYYPGADNYDPDELPYQSGVPRSACPSGSACNMEYPGLCTL